MAIRRRLYRSLWLSLLLLILAISVAVFTLIRMGEGALRTERRFGNVRVQMFGPGISPLLALNADSALVRSPSFRLKLIRPSARLIDWFSLRPSSSTLYVRVDSAALTFYPVRDTTKISHRFPVGLRFPVSATVEWRVLTVQPVRGSRMDVAAAQWRSRGRLGIEGDFFFIPYANDLSRAGLGAQVKVSAGWRGPNLHYELTASRQGDRLFVSGFRDKLDLRQGTDSVDLASEHPSDWLPSAVPSAMQRGFGALSDLRVKGKADWRARNIHVTGGARTAPHDPLQSCTWTFDARAMPRGGNLSLAGDGASQSFRARGSWSHPEGWPGLPPLRQCRAEFSGESRGGEWALARWKLPLDFEVSSGHLDTGLKVSAHVVTRDKSEIDLAWSGDLPGKVEFSGPVSPREAWAVAWTDSNVSYAAASVRGEWQNGRVSGVTRLRGVRAYGASADSLEAGHEVTSSMYTLQSARIYKNGEVFTGFGHVRWKTPAGVHAVSLRFEAMHPEYGQAVFEMPRPGLLEATADNLKVASFPYDRLARFAAFNPWLDGRFRWDLNDGTGEADLSASYSGAGSVLQANLRADWDSDSLRARSAEMTAGPSRVAGTAVLPLRGLSLRGLKGAQNFIGATWKVVADSLRLGDVYALAGHSTRPVDGYVNGTLEYSPSVGLSGEMKTGSLKIPSLREWIEVGGVSVRGSGDSLRVAAVTTSKQYAVLNDTVGAVFTGLDSRAPRFWLNAASTTGFRMQVEGRAPEWKRIETSLRAAGSIPLGNHADAQTLDSVVLEGDASAPLGRGFMRELRFDARRFQVRYALAGDSQTLSGTPVYADGGLLIPDLMLRDAHGGSLIGVFSAAAEPLSARFDMSGARIGLALESGQTFTAEDVTARAEWAAGKNLTASLNARSGSFAMPPMPYRAEGAYDALRVQMTLPPPGPTAPPAKLFARVSVHDFLFQRKINFGWKDVFALFTSIGRSHATASSGNRTRAWDLDVGVEAKGTHNHIDTDFLRMTFIGDVTLQGVPPYTLVNGRVTGIQGEVGQSQQAYLIRDLDVKWDNGTLQDGVLLAEGEKKVRSDCLPDTRQTCMMYIKLDGRLQDVNFTYDTDCGQNTGEVMAPAVLLRSMTQGCYAGDLQGGETGYGKAAADALTPVINSTISSGIAKGSGGFIKSTQVSGLGAWMGGDSSGFEAVAVEVESKEVHRTGFKARVGYHPEIKQANPYEGRMALEYRPPVEKWASDSAWSVRLKDRFTVEAAVETRPDTRDLEADRQVSQRVGLRYRNRFWGLW